MITKYFGMYVYVDKFDYMVNNMTGGEFTDEIDEIDTKIEDIELNNLEYMDR